MIVVKCLSGVNINDELIRLVKRGKKVEALKVLKNLNDGFGFNKAQLSFKHLESKLNQFS